MKYILRTTKRRDKMPVLKSHPRKTELTRYTVCIRPEVKKLLEDYAYKNGASLSYMTDALIEQGIKKDIAALGKRAAN